MMILRILHIRLLRKRRSKGVTTSSGREKLKVQLDAAKKALHEKTEELDAIARLAEADKVREQSKIISRERREQVGILNYAI